MQFQFKFLDGLKLSGIERSNYIVANNLGQKNCLVSGIEKIRYSECLITLKIEGGNSGPTKSSGFMGIPVLSGSDLKGFTVLQMALCIMSFFRNQTSTTLFPYFRFAIVLRPTLLSQPTLSAAVVRAAVKRTVDSARTAVTNRKMRRRRARRVTNA